MTIFPEIQAVNTPAAPSMAYSIAAPEPLSSSNSAVNTLSGPLEAHKRLKGHDPPGRLPADIPPELKKLRVSFLRNRPLPCISTGVWIRGRTSKLAFIKYHQPNGAETPHRHTAQMPEKSSRTWKTSEITNDPDPVFFRRKQC